MEEYSILKYSVNMFFNVLMGNRPLMPISTLLCKLALGVVKAENSPDDIHRKRIEWIYKNTHDKVKEPLPTVEFAVSRNINASLSREIEIGNKAFNLTELYNYLDEISKELYLIVIEIASKYALDIPMTSFTQHGANQSMRIT